MLEDNPERVEWLEGLCPEVEVTHVANIADFRRELPNGPWSLVVLDHDLGGPWVGPDVNGETGWDAAEAVLSAPEAVGPVLVWSGNRAAARGMWWLLDESGWDVELAPAWEPRCAMHLQARLND